MREEEGGKPKAPAPCFVLLCGQQRLTQTQPTLLLPLGPRLEGHPRSGLWPFQAFQVQSWLLGPGVGFHRSVLNEQPPSSVMDRGRQGLLSSAGLAPLQPGAVRGSDLRLAQSVPGDEDYAVGKTGDLEF